LGERRLNKCGIDASKIRAKFKTKANQHGTNATIVQAAGNDQRSRRGLVMSVASRSIDGRSEFEIRRQNQSDTVPSRQYAARKRKELPLEEQKDIVVQYIDCYVP